MGKRGERPHIRTQRQDLPPDYEEVDRIHNTLRQRAQTRVKSIVSRFAQMNDISRNDAEKREWLERVLSVLGGVAQSIRATMPRMLRRRGHAHFLVEKTSTGDIQGHWEGESSAINLEFLISTEAEFVEFDAEQCEMLSRLVCSDLLKGKNIIPGFHVDGNYQNYVSLAWQRSVISC